MALSAMITYEIDRGTLLLVVPRGTELDSLDNRAFVSVAGSLFLKMRILGLPIPFHRNLKEVNLRICAHRPDCGGSDSAMRPVVE